MRRGEWVKSSSFGSNDRRPTLSSSWPLLAFGLLFGCTATDDSLERVRADGLIRIGYAVEPPYGFVGDDARPTGESPEIALRVVARLGIAEIRWQQLEFTELTRALIDGEIDVIAAGMFVTPERELEVAFSRPTLQVSHGLLVAEGNPLGLHSHAAAVAAGAVVAVLAQSVEEDLLLGLGIDENQLIRVPEASVGVRAVSSGAVDALALSQPTLRWMIAREGVDSIAMADPFEQPDQRQVPAPGMGAFAFRPTDRSLREAWDRELGAFLGTPEHQRLAESFGFLSQEVLGAPGHESLR